MSINAKLNRLSLDLHNVSKKSPPSKTTTGTSQSKASSSPVAESWEDESLSDSDPKSPSSTSSTPIEAPGPSIKSPTTLAADAAAELSGQTIPDNMPTPPPTPISPQMLNAKIDWSPATMLGGGRPVYSASTASSNTSRSTPTGTTGTTTPTTHRYPTPNPPTDSTARDKRPEKTTATANRLIAGALGIRAPPKTEEQRRYDRAVKEQEIKRRNREREERKREEEEDEKAKAAVWGS